MSVRYIAQGIKQIHQLLIMTGWLTVSIIIAIYWALQFPGYHLSIFLELFVSFVFFVLLFYRIESLLKDKVRSEEKERKNSFIRRESSSFQGFCRELNNQDEKDFCDYWGKILNLSVNKHHIRYLENRIRYIEHSCIGRLASNSQDVILHLLVAEALEKEEKLDYMEIGALYGVNAIVVYDLASTLFKDCHITMIDPLEGYYGDNKRDPCTGLPITEKVILKNMELHKISQKSYTLIKEYSTDRAAFSEAKKKTYNYLFIDGDHSYEGIKEDFEKYSPLLRSNGYLLIDDYGNPNWPDVTKFVDKVIKTSNAFECLGHSWKTIVFRKYYI